MPLALLGFGLVALIHLGAQLFESGGAVAGITQVLLMPLLAMTVVARARLDRRLVQLTLAALFFSWLGDTAPRVYAGDEAFLVMVGCFLVAQIIYAVAFWPHRSDSLLARPWWVLPYLVAGVGLVWWCADGADSLLIPVIVYAAALVTMAVLATGLGTGAGLGGLLFLASDAMIAVREFADSSLPGHAFWVMLTYIAAQVLLVDAATQKAAAEVSGPAARRA